MGKKRFTNSRNKYSLQTTGGDASQLELAESEQKQSFLCSPKNTRPLLTIQPPAQQNSSVASSLSALKVFYLPFKKRLCFKPFNRVVG